MLANAILVVHTLFVLFVVLSVPVICIGGWREWGFVRNPWFRICHVGAIGFVVVNTWAGNMCPLTIWENDLRVAAGETGNGESFIAYWFSRILFWDLPGWGFTLAYSLFGGLVLALFWLVPVQRKKA